MNTTISKENNNFIWTVNLDAYPAKTILTVGYNCSALCIADGKSIQYVEGQTIEINRRHGREVQVLAVTGESLDINWGCSGVNITGSNKPKYTLGMNGKLTVKVTNLNVFHREFNEIHTDDKVSVTKTIWNKLHVEISKAAESALKLVASNQGGNIDNDLLHTTTETKVREVFIRYGLTLLTLSINGGVHTFAEDDGSSGSGDDGSFHTRLTDILNPIGKTEEQQAQDEVKKLESQHLCPRCGQPYTGNLQKCPGCGKEL